MYHLASSSSLHRAVEHVLLHIVKVAPESVVASNSEHFSVTTSGGIITHGVLPIISALRQLPHHDDFLGRGPEGQALVNQWSTLAVQVSSGATEMSEAEKHVTERGATNEFLCGTPRANIADVLFYAAVAPKALTSQQQFPSLSRWATFAERDEYIAPIKASSAAAATATGGAPAAASSSHGPAKPSAEEIERRRIEKEKAKAEKAAKQQAEGGSAAAAPAAAKAEKGASKAEKDAAPEASQLDIRVGQIVNVAAHPEAEKLFVESIDFGNGEVRTIVSGLVAYYTAEQLKGRHCLVVCNMKPRALRGVTSQGMVLCASTEAGALELVPVPEGTLPGTRVAFGGKALGSALPGIPSQNAMTELLSHLRTDDKGAVTWKDEAAAVPAGPVISNLQNAVVK